MSDLETRRRQRAARRDGVTAPAVASEQRRAPLKWAPSPTICYRNASGVRAWSRLAARAVDHAWRVLPDPRWVLLAPLCDGLDHKWAVERLDAYNGSPLKRCATCARLATKTEAERAARLKRLKVRRRARGNYWDVA